MTSLSVCFLDELVVYAPVCRLYTGLSFVLFQPEDSRSDTELEDSDDENDNHEKIHIANGHAANS